MNIFISSNLDDDDINQNYKIKKLISDLNIKYPNTINISTLGRKNNQFDMCIKKYCLKLNIDYNEIIRYDNQWNPFCINEKYKYNKPYSKSYHFMQMNDILKWSDYSILYCINNNKFDFLIQTLQKKGKRYKIINVDN